MKKIKKHFTKFIMAFTLAFTCLFVAFGCTTFAYTYDSSNDTIDSNWQLVSLSDIKLHFKQYTVGTECIYNDGVYLPNQILTDWSNASGTDVFFNQQWLSVYKRDDNKYYFDFRNFVINNTIDCTIYINGVGLTSLEFYFENEVEFNDNYYYSFVSDYYNNLYRIYVPFIYNSTLDLYDLDIKFYGPLHVNDNSQFDVRLYNNFSFVPYVKFNIDNQFKLRNKDKLNDSSCLTNSNGNIWFLKDFKTQSDYTKLSFDFDSTRFEELYENNVYSVYAFSYNNFLPLSNYFDFYISEYIKPNTLLDYVFYNDVWIDYDLYSVLLQNYQDYQDSHSYTNQQYNDLNQNYQDYQDSHSYTNQQYNDLNQNYQDYQDSHSYTNQQYNTLKTALDYQQYGWLMYVDNLDVSILNGSTTSYNFNQLVSGGYLSNGSLFKLYDLSLINNPNYTQITFEFYFNDSVNNLDTFNYSLLEISTRELFGGYIYIYDDDNNVIIFNVNDVINIDSKSIDEKNVNGLFNGNIYEIKIVCSSPDNVSNIYTNNFYGMGYQQGRNSASYFYEGIINELNNKVDNLVNTNRDLLVSNNNLTQSVSDLQSAYNTLNQSYQNMLNGNNFANLFFTIAETPFASFKQIWNVDFLGVNLAGFVTGILFIGLIIWVIKKIF